MDQDETKTTEKKIYANMNAMRSIIIEIDKNINEFEETMDRIDRKGGNEPLKGELGKMITDKIPDWDSQTLSEKIWYTKGELDRTLNYLQVLNKRFNSLV
jgi:hypothetical protein